MSDQETALKAALARAEEAETNMKLAAQYGQELIEKLSKSEKIQVELEQEKHSLKLQLQSKESNEKAMQDEINGMYSEACYCTIFGPRKTPCSPKLCNLRLMVLNRVYICTKKRAVE